MLTSTSLSTPPMASSLPSCRMQIRRDCWLSPTTSRNWLPKRKRGNWFLLIMMYPTNHHNNPQQQQHNHNPHSTTTIHNNPPPHNTRQHSTTRNSPNRGILLWSRNILVCTQRIWIVVRFASGDCVWGALWRTGTTWTFPSDSQWGKTGNDSIDRVGKRRGMEECWDALEDKRRMFSGQRGVSIPSRSNMLFLSSIWWDQKGCTQANPRPQWMNSFEMTWSVYVLVDLYGLRWYSCQRASKQNKFQICLILNKFRWAARGNQTHRMIECKLKRSPRRVLGSQWSLHLNTTQTVPNYRPVAIIFLVFCF